MSDTADTADAEVKRVMDGIGLRVHLEPVRKGHRRSCTCSGRAATRPSYGPAAPGPSPCGIEAASRGHPGSMTSHDMWNHRQAPAFVEGVDLTGWPVEATDGTVGRVDKHSAEVDSSYLVVDTGVWIFGKEVLIPAGTITRIELDEQRVHVGLSRVQIENAPDFDRNLHLGDPAYRDGLSTHYGPGYPVWAPPAEPPPHRAGAVSYVGMFVSAGYRQARDRPSKPCAAPRSGRARAAAGLSLRPSSPSPVQE